MPQPIAYNTGSQTSGSLKLNGIEYAISSSIVSGSNGQRWFTSVNPGNGIVLVTNSFTQSYSTYQNSTPLFYTASALTAAAITGAINGLPDRFGLPQFTDTASAFAWVANSGKYFMMNYEYPQIVTDRLSLLIDANFLASYPTTQSTWYDVSGNGFSTTLVNGPTFQTGGWFNLDGTDDRIQRTSNILTTTTGTVVMWLRTTDQTWLMIEGNTTSYYLGAIYLGGAWYNNACGSPSYFVDTKSSTNPTSEGYIDGRFHMFEAKNVDLSGWTTHQFLDYNGGGTFNMTGDVAKIQMYNRNLTAAESKQNYFGSPIVTDGLVLAVDANNIVSYPKSGTTAYPLTSSVNGTLINGTSFNPNFGGYWAFDGVDDYISWGNNFNLTSTSISGFVWGWANSLNDYLPWIDKLSSNGNYRFHADSVGRLIFGIRNTANAYEQMQTGVLISPNTWYHLGFTFNNSTKEGKIYLNGQLQLSNTFTIDRGDTTTDLQTGYQANNGGTLNGRIATLSLYNRELSASEVAQNFNAQRSRFGI